MLLPSRRAAERQTRARAPEGHRRRALRRGRLADTEGRITILGSCRYYRSERQHRQTAWIFYGDPGRYRTEAGGGAAAGERAAAHSRLYLRRSGCLGSGLDCRPGMALTSARPDFWLRIPSSQLGRGGFLRPRVSRGPRACEATI